MCNLNFMSIPFLFQPPSDVFGKSKIRQWKIRAGEPFMEGQPLVEIESLRNDQKPAKATLLAPISGYVDSVTVNERSTISTK